MYFHLEKLLEGFELIGLKSYSLFVHKTFVEKETCNINLRTNVVIVLKKLKKRPHGGSICLTANRTTSH